MNYTRRHLWLGWWSLLGFLVLGLALELLHGFKAGLYLDVQNETRRLMWTLAHAHGALLGLVHIAFALSLPHLPSLDALGRLRTSWCLIGASVLLPGGFFAGGLRVYAGDPGPGIILAPIGATSLLIAVFLAARASGSAEVQRTPSNRRD
jgi:hypothetical protein